VVVKAAAEADPQRFCEIFNKSEKVFPVRWKAVNLVLIAKPGKQLDNPSSYGPICLLDDSGIVDNVVADA